jgi:hypothetical protein
MTTLCTVARKSTGAVGVALLVFGGDDGHGISMQAPMDLIVDLPRILRDVADKIELNMVVKQ